MRSDGRFVGDSTPAGPSRRERKPNSCPLPPSFLFHLRAIFQSRSASQARQEARRRYGRAGSPPSLPYWLLLRFPADAEDVILAPRTSAPLVVRPCVFRIASLYTPVPATRSSLSSVQSRMTSHPVMRVPQALDISRFGIDINCSGEPPLLRNSDRGRVEMCARETRSSCTTCCLQL